MSEAPKRIWPDAADGSPSLPMEPELWAAGCDLDTARFVARQLANDGYTLVKADEVRAQVAVAYKATANVAAEHRAEYFGRHPLSPSAAHIDERMGAAAGAVYTAICELTPDDAKAALDALLKAERDKIAGLVMVLRAHESETDFERGFDAACVAVLREIRALAQEDGE